MAIFWFDTVPRLSSRIEPLNRAGWLPYKDYPIERTYDNLSFSFRIGAPDMEMMLETAGGSTIVKKTHCMLVMPGEFCRTTMLKPCHELYFVFEHPERIFGGRPPIRRELGLYFPPEDSIFFGYIEAFKKLLETPVSSSVCTQLDCLALAILAETFYDQDAGGVCSAIEKIEGYINNHYAMPLDFPVLAKRFGLSFSSFRKLWSERHELPPGATVMNLRNRHAKELLLTSTMNVGEIAAMVGYPDPRYFSRFFRRMNGMTPGKFRKENSQKNYEDSFSESL